MENMIYTNEICYCLHTGVADSYRVAVLRKQEGDNVYEKYIQKIRRLPGIR